MGLEGGNNAQKAMAKDSLHARPPDLRLRVEKVFWFRSMWWSILQMRKPRLNRSELEACAPSHSTDSLSLFLCGAHVPLAAFLVAVVAQTVERLSAMQETRLRSLGREDPLEKEMAAHCSILAWKIPWTAEPGRLLSMGWQRVGHN